MLASSSLNYQGLMERADALEMSLSAYYRRVRKRIECTKSDIEKVASILGWEVAWRIFFGNGVS